MREAIEFGLNTYQHSTVKFENVVICSKHIFIIRSCSVIEVESCSEMLVKETEKKEELNFISSAVVKYHDPKSEKSGFEKRRWQSANIVRILGVLLRGYFW